MTVRYNVSVRSFSFWGDAINTRCVLCSHGKEGQSCCRGRMFRLSALQVRGGTYRFHQCSSFYSNVPRNHTLQWNRGIFWYNGRGKV